MCHKKNNFAILRLYVFIFIGVLPAVCVFAERQKGFHSDRPAQTWEEYLVSGNGTMGLMVAGNPYNEELVVNHTSLFLPCNEPKLPPSQGKHLKEIKELMLKGEYQKASELLIDISNQDGYGKKRQSDLFIPAFQVNLKSDSVGYSDYSRSVDFMTGETKVAWADRNGSYERRSFVSRTDNVIITEILARRGRLNLTIDLNLITRADPKRKLKYNLDDNYGRKDIDISVLVDFVGLKVAWEHPWKHRNLDYKGYEGAVKVSHKGGYITVKDGKLIVKNATEVMLEIMVEPVSDLSVSPTNHFAIRLKNIKGRDYKSLLVPHKKIQTDLMNRVTLNLGAENSDYNLSSEDLLKLGGGNKALIEHLFDAARYNIISSCSLKGISKELPFGAGGIPCLQGIWGATMTPPWAGDYTTNGNLPTAVSHLLAASTPELILPLFDKLESQMGDYRENAKVLFNCRGIHIPSHIQLHGYDNQFDATWPMTFWTAGAAWYSMFYYDYYLYTRDEKFLRERALPFMREAVHFYEDFLVPSQPSTLTFVPSYSPENHPENSKSQACINATMDVAVCKSLLRDFIDAATILGIDDKDVTWCKVTLPEIPKYEVNSNGELREWLWKDLEDNHEHRHASHLIGMYYRKDPEIMSDDTLRKGVLKAIQQRLNYRKSQSGAMAFGLSQLCYPACLIGDGNMAYDMLTMAGDTYFNDNLMTTHDPHRIFNTDMSGAYPEMVMMMLAYSDVDSAGSALIDLLPACPESWKEGSINGMALRGGIRMDRLVWSTNGVKATLTSGADQNITVTLRGKNPQTISLKMGKPTELRF